MVAGELFAGESVAVEFWLPRVEQPLKARALVRYHHQLRCGLEFLGLSAEQQALIHSWTQHEIRKQPASAGSVTRHKKAATVKRSSVWQRTLQLRTTIWRYRFRIALLVVLAGVLGWWRWQRGWTEIEAQLPAKQADTRPQAIVPAAEMEQHITHKVDPVYPEAARQVHVRGVVVLHAIIGSDGTVLKLEKMRGPEVLAQAAMDAARWWRYEPYVLNGKPVEVETTIEVPFNDYHVSMTAD